MNLPLHEIHCPMSSYGRLLLPVGGGRWLAWFYGSKRRRGLHLTCHLGFHNCTTSGVR